MKMEIIQFSGGAGSIQPAQGWEQRDVMAKTLPKFGCNPPSLPLPSSAELLGAITSLFIEDPGGCSPRPEQGAEAAGGERREFILELEEKKQQGKERGAAGSESQGGFGLG